MHTAVPTGSSQCSARRRQCHTALPGMRWYRRVAAGPHRACKRAGQGPQHRLAEVVGAPSTPRSARGSRSWSPSSTERKTSKSATRRWLCSGGSEPRELVVHCGADHVALSCVACVGGAANVSRVSTTASFGRSPRPKSGPTSMEHRRRKSARSPGKAVGESPPCARKRRTPERHNPPSHAGSRRTTTSARGSPSTNQARRARS